MEDQIKFMSDEDTVLHGISELSGLGAAAKKIISQRVQQQAAKKLRQESLTRDQRLLLSQLDKLAPQYRKMLQNGDFKVSDFELYAAKFMGSTGNITTQSTIKLIQDSDKAIEGVRNFDNRQIPSQANVLVTGIGIEIAAITQADAAAILASTGIGFNDEKFVNFLTFDSTQLPTSKPNRPALLNPTFREALPEVLMNAKLRASVNNKLVEEHEVRNLSNSGGAYAAARGIYDIKKLQTPFMILDQNQTSLELELPRNGTFPQLNSVPTATLPADIVWADAYFYVKVRLQTIMISPR